MSQKLTTVSIGKLQPEFFFVQIPNSFAVTFLESLPNDLKMVNMNFFQPMSLLKSVAKDRLMLSEIKQII